ncbi:MAG TPA: tRNA pseudouridine(38-40) synthase TruA [Gammaproteobacteria bacterium]|jgi:tRNA pseudouridine38-40 synthase|nr:tRNA pseudouridine(38-40) synthase TruA [Gammaproteobacteria bacterium]
MPRIALGLEYDGTDFVGWQVQRAGRSIEAAIASAVQSVADEPVTVHGAGRTDAGVHAAQQVAHFDTSARRNERQWLLGINSNLPPDVAVRWVREVPATFDARRSALRRRYRYSILQQPTRPALARGRVWWIREPLDAAAMTAASLHWLGEHDFSAFRAAGCQAKSPRRRLMAVRVARAAQSDGVLWQIDFIANAFLQHMVRNLVGALVEIGRGDLPAAAAHEMLVSRDRTQAAVAAPPGGLTLLEVLYPEHYGLPSAGEAK